MNYDFFKKNILRIKHQNDYSPYLWNELILNLSIQNLNS